MSRESLLELRDVKKSFRSPGGPGELPVLKGVNLSVASGETLAVVGPSGSGKSTLLSIMGGLDEPSAGTVFFGGRDLARMTIRERALMRNRSVGFLFQAHHLLPQCSVWENVLVPTLAFPKGRTAAARRHRDEAAARASRLIRRVGLAGRVRHRPGELSGGECLRAALARALINGPDVLLADEPTGSLDAESAASLAELLMELNREEGVSLVVVTHSALLAAMMGRCRRLQGGVLLE